MRLLILGGTRFVGRHMTAAALDRGVWVRPFRNLVYTMPPYVCTQDDLGTITAAMIGAVEEVHG